MLYYRKKKQKKQRGKQIKKQAYDRKFVVKQYIKEKACGLRRRNAMMTYPFRKTKYCRQHALVTLTYSG